MAQPAAAQTHVDSYGPSSKKKRRKRRKLAQLEQLTKAEFTAEQRRQMAKAGVALPDGSYPIPNRTYLKRAIRMVGLGKAPKGKIRAHIIARARALGLSSMIPADWKQPSGVSKAQVKVTVPILKADLEQQLIYGVALTPGVEDSQGDVLDAAEIEKAAHGWLAEYRSHDVQHNQVTKDADGQPFATPVESFIAPQDLQIGEKRVLKGAWVIGAKVHDPQAWRQVKDGKLTGFSIGGSGERHPL